MNKGILTDAALVLLVILCLAGMEYMWVADARADTFVNGQRTADAGTMAEQDANAVAITGGTASGLAYVGFTVDTDHDNTPAYSCLWLTDIGLFLVAPNKTIYPVQIGAGELPAS
jgi:hypothetical protein